jgi:hypothetical protein
MKIRIRGFVMLLRRNTLFHSSRAFLSFRAERSVVEKSLDLSILQHISTKIIPSWIQSINQADLLRSGPFLQLRFSSDSVADITIMLVIGQFFALILCGEPDPGSFAVFPSSAREPVGRADIKN